MVWYPEYNYILGSKSPRRQEILRQLGLPFTVVSADGAEEFPEGLYKAEIALHIAREKAKALRDRLTGNDFLITADTIVWIEGEVLAKPDDAEHALKMLQRLSGAVHEVITGVCLTTLKRERSFYSVTEVFFKACSDAEIEHYVETCRPFDKAGAYGIQEWIGLACIERINGSYFNVVGLPADRLYSEIKNFDSVSSVDMLKNR